MQRLKNGESFDKVAKEMSEDKAKAGKFLCFSLSSLQA